VATACSITDSAIVDSWSEEQQSYAGYIREASTANRIRRSIWCVKRFIIQTESSSNQKRFERDCRRHCDARENENALYMV
jgi:hypothetical protein